LKLYGFQPPYINGYFILGQVICGNPHIVQNVNFHIDTGCSITTISFNDAYMMNINFNLLNFNIPVSIANGQTIHVAELRNIGILFDFPDYSIFDKLKKIHIQPFSQYQQGTSLLGLDVLSRYTLKYENNIMILER
jgi:hypothetical protein